MAETPQVAFRAVGPLEQLLKERNHTGQSLGGLAQRDLLRYYGALANELAAVDLTAEEACLICDVIRGWLMDDMLPGEGAGASGLPMEVADGIALEHLDEKWGVDGPQLVEKVMRWSHTQRLAVCDAAERWWARDDWDGDDYADQMRAVGLVRTPRQGLERG